MPFKIKPIALVVVAIAMTGALTAAPASAGSLDIGQNPAVLTGQLEQGQSLGWSYKTTKSGTFNSSCQSASVEGTTQGQAVTELTLTATYAGCTQFGSEMKFTTNGCKYTLTGSGTPARTFEVDIVGCTSGKGITFPLIGCTMSIPEQNGLGHAVLENGPNNHVQLRWTLSNIKIEQQEGTCFDGPGHVSQGFSLSASTTLTAFTDQGGSVVTMHNHQFVRLSDGASVSLTAT